MVEERLSKSLSSFCTVKMEKENGLGRDENQNPLKHGDS